MFSSLNQTRATQTLVTESDAQCGHHTLKTGTLSATLLITKDTAEVHCERQDNELDGLFTHYVFMTRQSLTKCILFKGN